MSLALFATIRGWERRELDKRAADLAHEQAEKLQVAVLRSMEVLHSIAALHTLHGGITPGQFQQFVQPTLTRQPELQALSWNPIVPAAERSNVETAARTEGLTQFQFCEKDLAGHLIPARARDFYVPVRFIEPLERNRAALGYDLASDECRRLSLEQARDTGKPVATAPIQLAQGPDNQAGFLVLLPVYYGDLPPTTIAERQRHLRGFAVAVFRVNDLVAQFFHELKAKGIEAALYDQSRQGQLLYAEKSFAQASDSIPLEIAGRQWALAFQALPEFAASASHFQSWLVLSGALAFTLLATAYLYGGWRRTMEIAAVNAALQEEVAVRQHAEAAADKANQAKSDFLASMSHEIRTPLNAILGYTQLMQRDAGLPPEQQDAVGGISASGQHLLGLINEILDLSKIEAGRMELQPVNFDLAMLGNGLAATFRPLCAQKKIRFRLEVGMERRAPSRLVEPADNQLQLAEAVLGAPFVRGDEGKLRQVLINLVGNAVKFTNIGEVCLRVQPTAQERWHFEVIDTGLGIPEAERTDIFKPFHQGSGAQHQGGTGLGLAIAQRQVELLGGKLDLESERGIGSCFHFELPLPSATDAVEKVSARVLRLAPGHSVCALVVDDNRENRDVLGRMLTMVGCNVLFATNGEEAMEQTRTNQPGIIFLDLLLPGASGMETARNILARANGNASKIIAHTASALSRHREEARAAGCVDFMAKPFEAEKLYECLERHLGIRFEREALAEPQLPVNSAVASIHLPEELSARLMVAAELHSTTALKTCLQELRAGGPEAERLAEEIRQLMRSYDMDGIQRLLTRVTALRAVPQITNA
jgi:signal transduction histidine kinase/CheY-like chemotaxis protein